MACAAEQLAANINFGALAKATELKKRIWFTLGCLIIYRLGTYIPIPGIDPVQVLAPLGALLVDSFEGESSLVRRDILSPNHLLDPVFRAGQDPDVQREGNLLKEEVPREAVVHDVAPLHVPQQGGANVRDVAFLAEAIAIQDGGRVPHRLEQLELGDVELLRGLENDFP